MNTINPVILKQSNYSAIHNFAMGGQHAEMQGTKLVALFSLIQKKGELIQTNDVKLKGLKALKISNSEWIAIKKTPNKGSFYPCLLETYLLSSSTK